MVPASADEPPPPRPAGLRGTVKPPAPTTCASVIVAFGSDSAASLSHAAGVCGALCATAAADMRSPVRVESTEDSLTERRAFFHGRRRERGANRRNAPAVLPRHEDGVACRGRSRAYGR